VRAASVARGREAPTALPRRDGRPSGRLDLVGVGLLLANVGWAVAASRISGGDPWPFVATLLGAGAAAAVARSLAPAAPWVVPSAVAAAGAVLLVRDPAGVLSEAPRAGPFGFSSITGAFYVQCALGAAMVGAAERAWPVRVPAGAAALGFALVPVATDTRSAAALLGALGAGALLSRGRRVFVVACAVLFVGALGFTLAAGADLSPEGRAGPVAAFAERSLSDRRVGFWRDGLALMLERPVAGVGAGNFGRFSPEARSDPDEPWAHNAFLQRGSEAGAAGFALLLALFLWAFVRLVAAPPTRVAALGAAALGSLAVHACIEHVMERPAVPIAAAALLGTALGYRGGRGRDARA
jgi:O-antigen ligase